MRKSGKMGFMRPILPVVPVSISARVLSCGVTRGFHTAERFAYRCRHPSSRMARTGPRRFACVICRATPSSVSLTNPICCATSVLSRKSRVVQNATRLVVQGAFAMACIGPDPIGVSVGAPAVVGSICKRYTPIALAVACASTKPGSGRGADRRLRGNCDPCDLRQSSALVSRSDRTHLFNRPPSTESSRLSCRAW